MAASHSVQVFKIFQSVVKELFGVVCYAAGISGVKIGQRKAENCGMCFIGGTLKDVWNYSLPE